MPTPTMTTSQRELRAMLVQLYENPASIRRVLQDAGVHTERLSFSGSPVDIWFDALNQAEREGRVGAVLAIARDEYPGNADLQRLLRDPAQPAVASAAEETPPNEFSLYEALTKLLPAQFEVVLFRLGVDVQYIPPSTAPPADRAIALLRLLKQAGRMKDLTVAIAAVTQGR